VYLEGAFTGRVSWAGQFGARYPGQRETSCNHFAYLGGGYYVRGRHYCHGILPQVLCEIP